MASPRLKKSDLIYFAMAALIVVIFSLLAGCGGEKDEETSSPSISTPSLAAQVSQVESLTAVIDEIEGDVTVKHPTGDQYQPVSNGDIVGLFSTIRTGEDGQARLTMSNGTIVRVGPNSLFTFESETEDEAA